MMPDKEGRTKMESVSKLHLDSAAYCDATVGESIPTHTCTPTPRVCSPP